MKSYQLTKKWMSKVFCLVALCFTLGMHAHAQSKTVSGTVKDTGGESLPGVSIFEKGTRNGTTSDTDGNYSLSVGANAVLVSPLSG